MEELRLNKYISNSGYCSRREADKYIEEGKVTIDGKIAELGTKVLPGQIVKVNGENIGYKTDYVYIALNKPVGIVSTTDLREKKNIVDFVKHKERIFPIGRLDKDSQGLILLTNDGDIVNKILRAGNNHTKEYIVTVNKPITPKFLEGMSKGVPILGTITKRCKLTPIDEFTFKIILTQGLNRQIRRMSEYFGYEVKKLKRLQIMNIKLGSLKRGQWRDLTEEELSVLFKSLENSTKTITEPLTKKTNSSKK